MATPANYLVTGASGLIGKRLVPLLLARGGHVHVLVRPSSMAQHQALIAHWSARAAVGPGEIDVIAGDIDASEGIVGGIGADAMTRALPSFDHVFHLAARYDLEASAEQLQRTNVRGTEWLVEFLKSRNFSGTLHHVSSIAVAGDHPGRFAESDLDVGQKHPHPYHQSKFDAEVLVRSLQDIKFRVYRPGVVVGDAKTGEMDRVDGAYFLFKPMLSLRNALPTWMPLPGVSSRTVGPINMVPVDFVAAALDALAHAAGLDGQTFHLVDPDPPSFRQSFNLLAKAAGAPQMSKTLGTGLLKYWPVAGQLAGQLGALKFFGEQVQGDLGIPSVAFGAMNHKVSFDTTKVDAALAETGVRCPPQAEYIPALWDYWLRHLNPDLDPARQRRKYFEGKTVLITGASSGIGEELALVCAESGAHLLLAARREEELSRVAQRCREKGARVSHYAVDLSDFEACDELVKQVLDQHGHVDVLVNNAARSIRRPLVESLERFHDFERVMQLNFFSPVRLIRGLLPIMRERGTGHIVNVLTAGVVLPTPLFGAYGSSKAALSHLTDTLGAEVLAEGVHCTGVFLPFVKTPMMDAKVYKDTDAMSPRKAAHWIADGVAQRRRHIKAGETTRRAVLNDISPALMTRITSVLFRIYGQEESKNPDLAFDRSLLKQVVKGRLL